MARNEQMNVNGLTLSEEQLRAFAQQPQAQQLMVASPMNDVQNISLCASNLAQSHVTLDAEALLDLATEIVAGAMARVVDGRFLAAVESAKLRAQAQASNLLAGT